MVWTVVVFALGFALGVLAVITGLFDRFLGK